jgi:hypothetical protein
MTISNTPTALNTAQFDSFLSGASATLGIFGTLNGLQSNDFKTQAGSVVGLLRSGNELVKLGGGTGFSPESLQLLEQWGAVLSIANLGNLEQMLNNGQVGSALATTVGASKRYKSDSFLWAISNGNWHEWLTKFAVNDGEWRIRA